MSQRPTKRPASPAAEDAAASAVRSLSPSPSPSARPAYEQRVEEEKEDVEQQQQHSFSHPSKRQRTVGRETASPAADVLASSDHSSAAATCALSTRIAFPSDIGAQARSIVDRMQILAHTTHLQRVCCTPSLPFATQGVPDQVVALLEAEGARPPGPARRIDWNARATPTDMIMQPWLRRNYGMLWDTLMIVVSFCCTSARSRAPGLVVVDRWDTHLIPALLKLLSTKDCKYDATAANRQGMTALDTLAGCGMLRNDDSHPLSQLFLRLLDMGLDVNHVDLFHRTPLVMQCTAEGVELLVRHGADINKQDSQGRTLIHRLVEHQNSDKLQMLFAECASEMTAVDWSMLDGKKMTALKSAFEIYHSFGDPFTRFPEEDGGDFFMADDEREEIIPKIAVASQILSLLDAQQQLWSQTVPPCIRAMLQHSILLPELAETVMQYAMPVMVPEPWPRWTRRQPRQQLQQLHRRPPTRHAGDATTCREHLHHQRLVTNPIDL